MTKVLRQVGSKTRKRVRGKQDAQPSGLSEYRVGHSLRIFWPRAFKQRVGKESRDWALCDSRQPSGAWWATTGSQTSVYGAGLR